MVGTKFLAKKSNLSNVRPEEEKFSSSLLMATSQKEPQSSRVQVLNPFSDLLVLSTVCAKKIVLPSTYCPCAINSLNGGIVSRLTLSTDHDPQLQLRTLDD
jgi:hypothetical protein